MSTAIPLAHYSSLAFDIEQVTGRIDSFVSGARHRLAHIHRQRSKRVVLEFEALPHRMRRIAKIFHDDRGRGIFDLHCRLWSEGFQPPSSFTVVKPLGYDPATRLFVQDKAAGSALSEILFTRPAAAVHPMRLTAGWLAALEKVPLDAEPRIEKTRLEVWHKTRELAAALPLSSFRFGRLRRDILRRLPDPDAERMVLWHGDFHPKNVFIAGEGRVTVIDLDTMGLHEPAADAGYFLGQVSTMGRLRLGTIHATRTAREAFLHAFLSRSRLATPRRLALHIALFFLQNLHFEICALKTGKLHLAGPWIANAERALYDGELLDFDSPAEPEGSNP